MSRSTILVLVLVMAVFTVLNVALVKSTTAGLTGAGSMVAGLSGPATLTALRENLPEDGRDIFDAYLEDLTTFMTVLHKVRSNYVEEVPVNKLLEGAMNGIMDVLDPYSAYIPPDDLKVMLEDTGGEFGGLGIEISIGDDGWLTVISPLEGTPASEAGVQAGDKIVKIDGESTEGIRIFDALKKLRGAVGDDVTISVVHPGTTKIVDITITRAIITIDSVKGYERLPDSEDWNYWVDEDAKIAYIRLANFQANTPEQFDKAIRPLLAQGMRGLVLDLRFNPGGTLQSAEEIADRFISAGKIVSVKGRVVRTEEYVASRAATLGDFELAVLVNTYSASASEIVASAIKDHKRGLVFGERTYGKGSVQWIMNMDDRSKGAVKLTVARYYTPKDYTFHRDEKTGEGGLAPDFEVPMTPEERAALSAHLRKLGTRKKTLPNGEVRPVLPEPGDEDAEEFEDVQLRTAVDVLKGILLLSESDVPAS